MTRAVRSNLLLDNGNEGEDIYLALALGVGIPWGPSILNSGIAIVADLHPVAVSSEWTMDRLDDDCIGLYEQLFCVAGLCVPFQPSFLRVRLFHYISDPVPKDGFNEADVVSLTHQPIDIRGVPSGLLFCAGLAVTWEFPKFYPLFKDHGGLIGNDEGIFDYHVARYLRLTFLSGMSMRRFLIEGLMAPDPKDSWDYQWQYFIGVGADEAGSSLPPPLFVPTWGIHQRARFDHPPDEMPGFPWPVAAMATKPPMLSVSLSLSSLVAVVRSTEIRHVFMDINAELALRIKELEKQLKKPRLMVSISFYCEKLGKSACPKDLHWFHDERLLVIDFREIMRSFRTQLALPKGKKFGCVRITSFPMWWKASSTKGPNEELRELLMRMNGFDCLFRQEEECLSTRGLFSQYLLFCGSYLILFREVGADLSKLSCTSSMDAPKAGSGGVYSSVFIVLHLPHQLVRAARGGRFDQT
ncbi:hypothetical protein Tco_0109953 [Tanacetum coccineum]